MCRFLLAVGFAAGALLAQSTPPSQPVSSVSGVVRDSVTQQPLEACRVHINGSEAVKTNPQGEFTVSGVPPGRQWISVNDERHAATAEMSVLVNAGENITGIEVLLKLPGAILGRVL